MYRKTIVRYIHHEEILRGYEKKWIISPPLTLNFWQLLECQWQEWVDRLCKWWLIERGFLKETVEPLTEIQTRDIEIDDKAIVEHVMFQADQILREFHARPEYVLVGIKQFIKVDIELKRMLCFELNGNMETHHPIQSKNLTLPWNGIKVILVPWMDGAIALPSLDKLH